MNLQVACYLSPSHVPHILPLKLQLFSYNLFAVLIRDFCVKVEKGQDPTDVNNGQPTENIHTLLYTKSLRW